VEEVEENDEQKENEEFEGGEESLDVVMSIFFATNLESHEKYDEKHKHSH